MKKLFTICWWLCAAAALVPVWYFMAGLGDGTVGADNLLLWMLLLGGTGAALYGSHRLRTLGRIRLAWLLLAVLLVPAMVALLFMVMLLVSPPHWQ
jgi:peptidoglycan/LPS O-acetylase OafA/YrhL